MKTYDVDRLSSALNGMAEAFDRKLLSPKAVEVWFETLKEFPTERVMGVLAGWTKHHTKFPAPGDVWKVLNEIGVEEREKIAAQERSQARSPIMFKRTEAGLRALEQLKKLAAGPALTPKEVWHRCMSLNAPGTFEHDMALEALSKIGRRAA